MKQYFLPTLLSFVFVLCSFVSHAQSPVIGDTIDLPPNRMGRFLADRLSFEVEMTPAQKEIIELIYKDRSEQIAAIEEDEGLTQQEKKVAILEIKNEAEEDIKKQLTSGQIKKYDERKASIKSQRQLEKSQNKLGQDAVGDLYESDI